MKQSLAQQFKVANEQSYDDKWINFLCSHQSDRLVTAFNNAMKKANAD